MAEKGLRFRVSVYYLKTEISPSRKNRELGEKQIIPAKIFRKKMKTEIITEYQIEKRKYWTDRISRLSADFGADSEEMQREIQKRGTEFSAWSFTLMWCNTRKIRT